ncbi:MAG: hypothetical protein HY812_12075 [Planctomycetes bacterium]|nr:hypothetical protein [Planctomycetota bacterium]
MLERPQVRDYLKTDPAAREAIEAVALLAQAMAGGAAMVRATPRATVRALSRPVEKARRYFKKELVDLLFDVGLADFNEATKAMGLAFDTCLSSKPLRPIAVCSRRIADLASALDLDPRSFVSAEALASLEPEQPGAALPASLARADRLMRACDAVLPGLDGVRFYLLLIPQLQGRPASLSEWLGFCGSVRWMSDKHHGLTQAAHAAVAAGRPDQALELSRMALRLSPGTALVPYFVALHGALAGELDMVAPRLADWSDSIGSAHAVLDLAATQVGSDADIWRRLARVMPGALSQVAARLAAPLAQAFEEVMR